MSKKKKKKQRKFYCEHVTMVFNNHENPVWQDLMDMSNTPVTIRLHKLYGFEVPEGLVWVISASIFDKKKNLNGFVMSGNPHVTVATPNGVPPVRAGELLQKMGDNEIKPKYTLNIKDSVPATLRGPE